MIKLSQILNAEKHTSIVSESALPSLTAECCIDLQKLRAATELFRTAFFTDLKKMPFGIRFIAREINLALTVST